MSRFFMQFRRQRYEMQYFVIFFLCCLLEQAISRPQAVTQENYKDAEEAEYENDEERSPEDSPHEDEDAAADEKDSYNKDENEAVQPRQGRNNFLKRHEEGRAVTEDQMAKESANNNFSEFKSNRRIEGRDDEAADNNEDQPESNSRRDKYSETNIANSQFIQESDNQRESGELRNQQLNKRRGSSEQDENSDMLYESENAKQERANKVDKNKRNFDTAVPSGQSRSYNHNYNRSPIENRDSENYDDSNRDRRNAKDPTDDGSNPDIKDKKDFDNFENEAEQAIIQRYIKKLSKKEVEELMHTLSDDKRALLEQIIDNDVTNQAINLSKREITKKAGAVAENSFMDGVQSDSDKLSGPLINLNAGDAVSRNNDATGMTTAIEEDLSSTKVDENKICRRSTDVNEESITEKMDARAVTTSSTESATAKSDNKREVNFNDMNNDESQEASITGLQDESYAGSQDEDMRQLMDDDAQLHYDYRSNPQKRDIMPETNADMAESMKSLQESFSNSNTYEDSGYYGGSNMVPLIRVKRRNKDHAVKKRDAAILPESKVAYVPENEDEDNDEGNEFYDDGFFDRTANFAKSNSGVDKGSDSRRRLLKLNVESNQSVFKRSNSLANDMARDTISIGTDTDTVLSGVEGVDENLMYSGGSRKKRAAEKSPKLEPADELINNDMFTNPTRSSLLDGYDRSENFDVSHNGYESFGPSSKSSDGELSRYKRIRRLKQPAPNKAPTSTEESIE